MSSDGSSRGPRPAHECFVCGPDNPIGLHLVFRLEDGACVSEFTPGPNHVGYPGVVHGGMIYSALDDVMANWLYLRGARAYTARRRKLVEMEAMAKRASDGKVVATATGTFVVVDEEEFLEVVGGEG